MKTKIIMISILAMFLLLPLASAALTTVKLTPTDQTGLVIYNRGGDWTVFGTFSNNWTMVSDNNNATGFKTTNTLGNLTFSTGAWSGDSCWDGACLNYSIHDTIYNVTYYMICGIAGGKGSDETATMISFPITSSSSDSAAMTIGRSSWTVYNRFMSTSNGSKAWLASDFSSGMSYGVKASALGSGESLNCSELWISIVANLTTDLRPTYSAIWKNTSTVYQNDNVNFEINATDDWALSSLSLLYLNQTGTYIGYPNTTYIADGLNHSIINVIITAAPGTNVSWYWQIKDDSAYVNNSQIQSFVVAAAGGDSCTYAGSGNWALNCADYCNFTSAQTIPSGNNITITGSGTLKFASGGKWRFSGSNQYVNIASGCTLDIQSGGGFTP